MAELPAGTVTFLFTDIEGSTRLWEAHSESMGPALATHDRLLREAVEEHHGHVVKTTGDGVHAVFASARDALEAAVFAQRQLAAVRWNAPEPLRVRMGVLTGETELRDGDYFGSAVNRAARLMGIAHGGQVVVSATSAALVQGNGFDLRDLGEHRLAGVSVPERVWQACVPGVAQEFPPLLSLDALPGNLPRQMSSFVGRGVEVREIADLLRAHRLVTLTGVGGVGKTRLALEVAADVVAQFADGSWLCELASLADPGAIWEALAAAFRLPPVPDKTFDELVVDHLRSKQLLLVLDNCEHMLDATATVVMAAREHCPDVVILATSREGLAVPGEHIIAVPSLGLPGEDAPPDSVIHSEAVELFCDRARAVRNDFAITDDNVDTVGLLCRRLDGIPLAIELAAARIRSLAPGDIVDRLDQRFKLLTRGSRAALERQQTLRNTIDWSYQLLDESERRALNRLSVFAGGCDLAAAEAVLGDDELDTIDVLDVMGQLVDKSLVLADPDETGHERYRLLETIRQYAQEQLEQSGEAATVRRRHADYFVALVESAAPGLRSPEQLSVARSIARDVDNLRAALDWSLEHPSVEHALRLVAPLSIRGLPIGYIARLWAEDAIALPRASEHALYPEVVSSAMWAATSRGDLATAQRYSALAHEAERRLGTRSVVARGNQARLALFSGDLEAARVVGEEWVELARREGNGCELTDGLVSLSLVYGSIGEAQLARRTIEEALQVARATGVPTALAAALMMIPWALLDEEPDRALLLLDEAIEVCTATGDRFLVSMAVTGRGVYHASQGSWNLALDEVRLAMEHLSRAGTSAGLLGGTLGVAAVVLTALGHLESGAIVLGASYHLAPAAYARPERLRVDAKTRLVEQLGIERYEELFASGAGLDAGDAMRMLDEVLAHLP